MNNWFWVCDITKYPDLWEKWKEKGVASIGWPPDFIDGNPEETRRLKYNLRQVSKMQSGDKIVAYLKDHRVGGIGTFERGIDPMQWKPLTQGEQGRQASVRWETLPDDGHYTFAPEDTTPPRMPTIRRIVKSGVFEEIERAMHDERRWGALPKTDTWVESEREGLHPLIADNLDKLETGLKPNSWGNLMDFAAPPVGRIDLLCEDREGCAVVIEAKTRAADDSSIGQLCRYMTWVRMNIKEARRVRGFVVAGEVPPMARFAAASVEGLELFRYSKKGKIMTFLRIPTIKG